MEPVGLPEALEPEPDEPEGLVDVLFSASSPPVPAVDAGETLLEAALAAVLKASSVLSPDLLDGISKRKHLYSDGCDLRSVDDTNHAVLAVLALAAVEPDGSRSVLDFVHEAGGGDLGHI